MNDDRQHLLDAAATVAMALYSFVAALGFRRVFGDWEFVNDVLIVVIVGHGLSWLLRQRRVHGCGRGRRDRDRARLGDRLAELPHHVHVGVPDHGDLEHRPGRPRSRA